MDNQYDWPGTPNGNKTTNPVIWLAGAFIPSIVGIACFNLKIDSDLLVTILLIIDFINSVVAAIGITRALHSVAGRIGLVTILTILFFFMNIVITLFAGCALSCRSA